MIVQNMTGYMLGNTNDILMRGDQWWPYDTDVYVCLTLERAREILDDSQINDGVQKPVWKTIYKVHASELPCTRIEKGLLYTNYPTQIFVDRVVYHRGGKQVSSQNLLQNAARIRNDFFKLFNKTHRGK